MARLRRRVAFERLLARLFMKADPPCLLKGGYAIELRLDSVARATKDIDLAFHGSGGTGPADIHYPPAIREWLQDQIEKDLSDWFVFRLGAHTRDLRAAPLGGARFHVEARLDNRTFADFNLDVGVGDAMVQEPEWITGHELLSFAGIPPARIALLPLSNQFAEKIHAYTVPRGERENSRVRDLIDLVLLIDHRLPSKEHIVQALRATFDKRETHSLPGTLDRPPESWREPYTALAKEHAVPHDTIEAAYDFVVTYWNQLGITQAKSERPVRKPSKETRRTKK